MQCSPPCASCVAARCTLIVRCMPMARCTPIFSPHSHGGTPCAGGGGAAGPAPPTRPPPVDVQDGIERWRIEVFDDHKIEGDGHCEFFVKWFGYPAEENTWEPEEVLRRDMAASLVDNLIAEYVGRTGAVI